MYRTLLGILFSLLAALGLVGLTFTSSVDAPAQFRFVNHTEPKTLDPGLATGEPEGRVIEALFEGLTRRDPKTLRPIPGVAQNWELSADDLTYTFHLRSDAHWSDGQPVTAHDFVFAWTRILEPSRGAEYAYLLYMIRHAEAYNVAAGFSALLRDQFLPQLRKAMQPDAPLPAADLQRMLSSTGAAAALQRSHDPRLAAFLVRRAGSFSVTEQAELLGMLSAELDAIGQRQRAASQHFGKDEGVYAIDPHTLVVQLNSPTPYFLALTAFYPLLPVPRWIVEQPALTMNWFLPETIVNNGAYNLKTWRVNDHIRLTRSATYWNRAQVHTEHIDVLPIENSSTALNLYLTGAVDWIPAAYPPELVHVLKQRPDFYAMPGMVVYFYRLNCERGPLRDRRVRQALGMAIDRQVIVDKVLGLGQIPAFTMVPPGMPGYESPKSALRYDPEKARELLAAAGFPGGQGFPEIGILYNTMETHKQIAEVVADQLRRNLGIPVNAYNQEWQSYIATQTARDYDIARAGWIGDYLDPNTFLDAFITNGGNNNTGFSSAAYDTLIQAAGNVLAMLASPEQVLSLVKDRAALEQLVSMWRQAPSVDEKKHIAGQIRLKVLAEAEAVLVQDEFPIIPIYFYVHSGLLSPKVKGFYTTLELEADKQAANLQDLHPLDAIVMDP